ncbi:MAG: ABC transporter ATP-binding protein [Phycisphaerales bacterium]
MTEIRLEGIRKRFGRTAAVDGVDLAIPAGNLYFLLGPSGCGKTTLLRMLAGFIRPDEGRILFNGRDVSRVPPEKRGTAMVFQSYALWPHLSVFENVAFGLKVRKLGRDEIAAKVDKALRGVRMEALAARKPTELSGGQQQRVALARAMVVEPQVLLLDEPLSNLDAKLRLEMRTEIRAICAASGLTAVYVTHDQEEALSMADGMVVLRDGKAMQQGPPRDLYRRPANRFVADFLGESNFIDAETLSVEGDAATLRTPAGEMRSTAFDATNPPKAGVTLSIRPEALRIGDGASDANRLEGTLRSTMYLGKVAQHLVALDGDGGEVKVFQPDPERLPAIGDRVRLSVDPGSVVVLPA